MSARHDKWTTNLDDWPIVTIGWYPVCVGTLASFQHLTSWLLQQMTLKETANHTACTKIGKLRQFPTQDWQQLKWILHVGKSITPVAFPSCFGLEPAVSPPPLVPPWPETAPNSFAWCWSAMEGPTWSAWVEHPTGRYHPVPLVDLHLDQDGVPPDDASPVSGIHFRCYRHPSLMFKPHI